MIGGKINTDDLPQECGIIDSELGSTWRNLGNNKYRIKHLGEEGRIFTFYKDNANLVKENSDGITKIIYEPY